MPLLMTSTGKRRRWPWLILVLAGVTLFVVEAGRILVVNAPQKSDLIVVLAGETDRRPALALDLLHHGYAPRILLDVPASTRIYDSRSRRSRPITCENFRAHHRSPSVPLLACLPGTNLMTWLHA